jgi:cytochrome P450/tRNA1(Val) A37 N6-methylase TrmN6
MGVFNNKAGTMGVQLWLFALPVAVAFMMDPSFPSIQEVTTITVSFRLPPLKVKPCRPLLRHLSSANTDNMYVADTTRLWNETLAATSNATIHVKRRPKALQFVAGLKYLWEVFRGTPHLYQYRLAQEHGDAYIIWNKYVTLTNADAIRDVLYVYNLEKPTDVNVGYKAMFFPTGGMLAAPWKEWIQQRRMTAPALSENVVGALAPKFEESSKPFWEILEVSAKTEQELELDYLFTCLTMDTIGLILLGRTFGLLERIRDNREDAIPFQEALNVMAQHSLDEMVYGFLPPRLNELLRKTPRKVLWAKKILNDFLDDCIEQRLANGVDSHKDSNLLNILLEAEQEGVISREALKAQLLLFVFAGYDTTSHTLSFMLYEVATNAALQEQLFQEILAVLPSRKSFPHETKILVDELPLLNRVWLETLRLHPSTATGVSRVVGESSIVVGDGLELPAKSVVSISTYAYHRNPNYWEAPETFDPSRWEPDKAESRDPITLMAFSAGPRNCLGSRLARAEALSFMATLLRRFHVRCTITTEPATFQSLTTKPRDGISFSFQCRDEANAETQKTSYIVSWNNNPSLKRMYSEAQDVRRLTCHANAIPLFQKCLKVNPIDRTAATWVAAEKMTPQRHDILGRGGTLDQRRHFVEYLKTFEFNNSAIANLVLLGEDSQVYRAKSSSAPLYLQPLSAGSTPPRLPSCPLGACVQLLLLACCLPLTLSVQLLGKEAVELMQELGVAFISSHNNLLVPYSHIMPVNVQGMTIYVVTDLHPTVLMSTTVESYINEKSKDNGAVMYVGPDSIGLVDQWCCHQKPSVNDVILDVGCGSGIQALSLTCQSIGVKVNSIDINLRALRFTKLNFEWNGLDAPILLHGDITSPTGCVFLPETDVQQRSTTWMHLLGKVTMIVSNPPFLPVPRDDPTINKRHGYFSNGGPSGEVFLESVIQLASKILDSQTNSSLAIVSEFMNPQNDFGKRLSRWWGNSNATCAILFTNQYPLDAATYASRRADSTGEDSTWREHLHSQQIQFVSPGFLFLKYTQPDATSRQSAINFSHYLVPKTEFGSIWTPTNSAGRQFVHRVLSADFFG